MRFVQAENRASFECLDGNAGFWLGLPIEKRAEQSPTHLGVSEWVKNTNRGCPAKPQCQGECSKRGASYLQLEDSSHGMEATHT